MAIKKQLQSKINGETVDVYPYTDTEVVYHDGQMLDDVLAQMGADTENVLTKTKEYTDEKNANTLSEATDYADKKKTEANQYTDTKIANLINGAPTALDTLKELSDAITQNQDILGSLDTLVNTKANQSDFKAHISDNTVHITQEERKTWNAKVSQDELQNAISENKHPTHTARNSGLYKITVDNKGHVVDVTAVTKQDIINLGIPSSDTNTHYESKNVVAGSASAKVNTTSALSNGNVYLLSIENGVVTSAHKITGSGATTVTTDASGNIIISSTDTNTDTTYAKATASALGLVKIGYVESGRNYPVELDSDGKMFVNVPWTDTNTDTDTKNTAGSTNSSAKLFLIGATSQATNPQTYSHDTTYIGTDGCLYSGGKKVSVEGHTHDSDYASRDHNHSAGDISSGTFAGNVVAPASTAYTTNMIRNGVITTVDPGENVSVSYANGSLIFVYE